MATVVGHFSNPNVEDQTLLSIRTIVESFPWDLLPLEKDLPIADMGTKRTTTFLDAVILRRVSTELRAYLDRLLTSHPNFDAAIGERLLNMPRICMLLKILDLKEYLSTFMQAEKTDGALPLRLDTAERLVGLDHAARLELEQNRAITRDFSIDKANVYREKQVIPVRTIKSLGHGGWAQVDCIENVVTGAQLARKRFTLKKALAKRLKESFETEIASLKKLSGHQHIIQYLYSYETEQSLNLLLSPVADCNLQEYLTLDDYELGNRNGVLMQSLGCLASALGFMHQHNIRHKDIKPQNVLLYQRDGITKIVVTDFGISFDFSSRNNSITDGVTHKTRKYCAPEVARNSPRGRRSDVYSLGCIYLEIITVLTGKSVDDLDEFFGGDTNYYESQEEMSAWVARLSQDAEEPLRLALEWCSAMIQRNALDRPYIEQTIDQISFQTKGKAQLRKALFCDICLSGLRIRNLITAEGVDEDDSENEKTDYEDNDERWDDDLEWQGQMPKPNPALASRESVKGLSDYRSYRTIHVHVVYTTKLFESCIRAFHSISKCLRSAPSLPEGSEVSIIRFEMEYLRLVHWSSIVGLSGSRQLSNDLLDNHHAILNVLLQQQTLLENSWKNTVQSSTLNLTHSRPEVDPKLPSSALSVALSIPPVGKAEELATRRFDAPPNLTIEELNSLVRNLITKNDDLIVLLSETSRCDLRLKEEEANAQMLQLYNEFDDLVALSTAIWPSAIPVNPQQDWPLPDDVTGIDETGAAMSARHSLAQYARLKAMNSAKKPEDDEGKVGRSLSSIYSGSDKSRALQPATTLGGPGVDNTKPLPTTAEFDTRFAVPNAAPSLTLDRKAIIFDHGNDDFESYEAHRDDAIYHPAKGQAQPVWIEWKSYEPSPYGGEDPRIYERVLALASLLNDRQRPKNLRVPHCLGLFHDVDPETGEDHCRYGLVFERPERNGSPQRLVSLLDLLHSPSVQPPPLGTRIELARSIAEDVGRLHAVNWLHKGLRSHNILYLSPEGTDKDEANESALAGHEWSLPYISGFEYSRPAMNDDMTEKPPESASQDIYRHPRVQGSGMRESSSPRYRYKRSYDIYSLGIILLEIAMWRSIEDIMGIESLERVKPSVIFRVRTRLFVEPNLRAQVQFSCGTKFTSVIWTCLGGLEAFGFDANSDESAVQVEVELQKAYHDQVVRALTDLAKAL